MGARGEARVEVRAAATEQDRIASTTLAAGSRSIQGQKDPGLVLDRPAGSRGVGPREDTRACLQGQHPEEFHVGLIPFEVGVGRNVSQAPQSRSRWVHRPSSAVGQAPTDVDRSFLPPAYSSQH